MKEKTCSLCKQTKDVSLFPKRIESTDGYRGQCKECRKQLSKGYNKSETTKINIKVQQNNYYTNKEFVAKKKRQAKVNRLKNVYGISISEYDTIMSNARQCSICGKTTDLVYDHDHITMKFRGILCRSCNLGLGLLGDTKESLFIAYKYLKEQDE